MMRPAGSIAMIAQCLLLVSCQAGLGGPSAQPAPGRQPFIAEFKKSTPPARGGSRWTRRWSTTAIDSANSIGMEIGFSM